MPPGGWYDMVATSSQDGVSGPPSPQAGQPGPPGPQIGISVVMPCLNEAESVARCVERAASAIGRTGLSGEVIVCDNGSTDGSDELARQAGATVVYEPERGYGSAYLRGFAAAGGSFIVMGDADESYDFAEIPNLLAKLREGYDYVVGSRFAGKILPGAMPWTHRYIGNPVLTGLLNFLFGTKLSDAHSGLRAMTKEAQHRLGLRCTGMELASEIAIRAAQVGLRTIEVPIAYHPRAGSSKLRPLRDGLRHLSYMASMLPGLMMILPAAITFVIAALALAVQPELLRLSEAYALSLTMLFVLIIMVSGQVVALGAAASLHARRLGGDATSRISRAIERALGFPAIALLGPALFIGGLAAELVSVLSASHRGLVSPDHLRVSVISLAVAMLGVQAAIAIAHLTKVHAGIAVAITATPAAASRNGSEAP